MCIICTEKHVMIHYSVTLGTCVCICFIVNKFNETTRVVFTLVKVTWTRG